MFAHTISIICFKYKCMQVYALTQSIKETVTPQPGTVPRPPETFTQQLNTPGTVTILQGEQPCVIWTPIFNTSRPRQNGRDFVDDIFKCIFSQWKCMNFA